MKQVFIFVNGILTFPGASDNWTGRAVTWVNVRTCHKAEKVEYFVGPVSRVLGQRERAHKLVKTLSFYSGWNIVLVGHSNGCDVILDALSEEPDRFRIKHLHLVSAACSADFATNGLNRLRESIDDVSIYIAERDEPLRYAASYLGKILGYGALGITGPMNANREYHIVRRDFGHSGWFTRERFNDIMQHITFFAGAY